MVTCDNSKQPRIQHLSYFAANDKTLWITYRAMVTMPMNDAAPRSN